MEAIVARLESVVDRLEKLESGHPVGGGAVAVADGEIPPVVVMFDDFINTHVGEVIGIGKEIGGELKNSVEALRTGFAMVRELILLGSKHKKPDMQRFAKLLEPLSKLIMDTQEKREKNRRDTLFHQISIISESIPILGWVSIEPTPAPYCKEMKDAGSFWSNKVRMAFRGKDERQIDFVKAWEEMSDKLYAYVKANHTTGLVWAANGTDLPATTTIGGAVAAPAGGPPPPPPPPAPMADLPTGGAPEKKGDMAAVFGELNRGTGVTSGLKRVTDDMKTKNRPVQERSGTVPAKAEAKPKAKPKFGAAAKPKDPIFMLDGPKWRIEYQKDNKNIVIPEEEVALKQVVYMFGCTGTVVQIKGKLNHVTLDNCKKCAIVCESVVAGVDLVNCQGTEVQLVGPTPTVMVDKCNAVTIYYSKESMECEVIQSTSSEINITLPSKTTDGDAEENYVPDQFKYYVNSLGRVVTEPVVHNGTIGM